MKKIILATKNQHKLAEFRNMLGGYEVLSLTDIGFEGDVAETGKTSTENAKIKALAIRDFCANKGIDIPVIADDSGLADALSTALFNMPYEDGLALINSIEGAEAIWVYKDGTIKYSENFEEYIVD